MLIVFQVCFYVGIGLTLLSIIFGSLFEAAGIDGLDLDFDIFGIDAILPINPTLYILFFTTFGGVGWILVDYFPKLITIFIIIIAALAGIFVSNLINYLVIKPLKKAQNTSAPETEELIGINATVTESIIAGGFGEISYIINGNSFNSPAKSTNGEEIKVGKPVAICWIEEHIFYVTKLGDI